MDERDIDERPKLVMTPEFDQLLKQVHASTRALMPDGHLGLSDDMNFSLRTAVDGLYAAFANYRINDPLSYCDHCITADDVQRLRATPLRELTHDDLWMVATNIVLTVGDDKDYRYFLPRMVDGLTENALYDPEIVFSRLPGIGFSSWPDAERTALNSYLSAQFDADLSIEPGAAGIWAISTLLCCIGVAGIDATPFLTTWSSLTDECAQRNLIAFICDEVSPAGNLLLLNAFWTDGPAYRQIIQWLHSPLTIAMAVRAQERFPLDGYEAAKFSEAIGALK